MSKYQSTQICCGLLSTCSAGAKTLGGHKLELLQLRRGSRPGLGLSVYCVSVAGKRRQGCDRASKFVIRADVAQRLYAQFSRAFYVRDGAYISSQCQIEPTISLVVQICLKRNDKCLPAKMPGCEDLSFLMALCNALHLKCEVRLNSTSRTVTPDLYNLWFFSSRVTTELLADAFNESRLMQYFCSAYPCDDIFGSFGSWQTGKNTLRAHAEIHHSTKRFYMK